MKADSKDINKAKAEAAADMARTLARSLILVTDLKALVLRYRAELAEHPDLERGLGELICEYEGHTLIDGADSRHRVCRWCQKKALDLIT